VAGAGDVGLELYDQELRPLASSTGAGAAALSYEGAAGQAYFVQVTGSGELAVQFSNAAALAAAMAQAADSALADEGDWLCGAVG
jgi:DMSO reductase anchor subunit